MKRQETGEKNGSMFLASVVKRSGKLVWILVKRLVCYQFAFVFCQDSQVSVGASVGVSALQHIAGRLNGL